MNKRRLPGWCYFLTSCLFLVGAASLLIAGLIEVFNRSNPIGAAGLFALAAWSNKWAAEEREKI